MEWKKLAPEWKILLLVDWPSLDIPHALLDAGYKVFSFSPEGYAEAVLQRNDSQKTTIVQFKPCPTVPEVVDIVVIYRPAEEHEAIIRQQVLPLKAKWVWLQKPVVSPETEKTIGELGLDFVEGYDIREIIKKQPPGEAA